MINFGKNAHVVLCLTILPCVIGCGDPRPSASVNGVITLDGQPVAGIGVSFEPKGSGAGEGSYGITNAEGRFLLRFMDNDAEGALIGVHRIVFGDVSAGVDDDDPEDGILPEIESRIPLEYMSKGGEFEVKLGTNEANFELHSK